MQSLVLRGLSVSRKKKQKKKKQKKKKKKRLHPEYISEYPTALSRGREGTGVSNRVRRGVAGCVGGGAERSVRARESERARKRENG
jgi:hypothetical protein